MQQRKLAKLPNERKSWQHFRKSKSARIKHGEAITFRPTSSPIYSIFISIRAVGAKDTSKQDSQSTAAAEAASKKSERKAIEEAEGGGAASGGGGAVMKTCKECKKKYNANSKKGCQNCVNLLFAAGGGGPAKSKSKK